MFLEIDFKSDLPIYEQIRRGIIIGLARGDIIRPLRKPVFTGFGRVFINSHNYPPEYICSVRRGHSATCRFSSAADRPSP